MVFVTVLFLLSQSVDQSVAISKCYLFMKTVLESSPRNQVKIYYCREHMIIYKKLSNQLDKLHDSENSSDMNYWNIMSGHSWSSTISHRNNPMLTRLENAQKSSCIIMCVADVLTHRFVAQLCNHALQTPSKKIVVKQIWFNTWMFETPVLR